LVKAHWKKRALGLALLFWLLGAQAAGFGLEMTDEAGRRVQLTGVPSRIVALAPSIAECLFALGLDQEVVGVTEHTNFPPQAASRPKVGSYVHLQLEAIVALRPDLVLATRDGNPREQIRRLEELGLKVFVLDPRSLEGLFRTLLCLGELLGRQQVAEAVVSQMRDRIEGIRRSLEHKPRPRVLLQVGAQPLVVAGTETLQDHLIGLAGGQNVAGSLGKGYPMLGLERVMTLAPEIILISSMADPRGAEQERNRWKRWKEIPAVKSGRIYVLDGDLIDRPSPRVVEGLEEMARIIHPEFPGQAAR
jgi:iron complex transport system substrate-binding protein